MKSANGESSQAIINPHDNGQYALTGSSHHSPHHVMLSNRQVIRITPAPSDPHDDPFITIRQAVIISLVMVGLTDIMLSGLYGQLMAVETRNAVALVNLACWWTVLLGRRALFGSGSMLLHFFAWGFGTTCFWVIKRIYDWLSLE